MKKIESSLKNMVLTLFLITAFAGAAMGFVFTNTIAKIEEEKMKKDEDAIKKVVIGFDNNPIADSDTITSQEGFTLIIYHAKKDGEYIGAAIKTMTKSGFSGEIKIMVGMKPDGTIINYIVLEHKETPGLGTKMDDWFKTDKGNRSVIGKNPGNNNLTVNKDGGEVDAITAATITSRAFLHAVEVAYTTYTQKYDATSSATTHN